LRLDYRMAEGDLSKLTSYVRELVQLRPDVMIGGNTPIVAAWLQETSTIPIVFTGVTDPVEVDLSQAMPIPAATQRDLWPMINH